MKNKTNKTHVFPAANFTTGAVRYMALWYYDVKAIHCPVYKLYKLDGLIVGHIYCSARANQTRLRCSQVDVITTNIIRSSSRSGWSLRPIHKWYQGYRGAICVKCPYTEWKWTMLLWQNIVFSNSIRRFGKYIQIFKCIVYISSKKIWRYQRGYYYKMYNVLILFS
jgi:hypothetical protein